MALLDRIFPWLGHARVLATAPSYADQDVVPLRADAQGRLLVTTEDDAAIVYSQVASTGTSGLVRGSAGVLWGLYAANLGENICTVQLFNLASGTPAPGATPQHIFPLPVGGTLSVEVLGGLAFSTGIVWALSDNPLVYEVPSGAAAHVIAKHRSP